MTYLKSLLVFTAVICVVSAYAARDVDLKVIANPSVSVSFVSADDLKNVFLATKTSLSGSHVEPVLEKNGPTHVTFLIQYLGQTYTAHITYYQSLLYPAHSSTHNTLCF